MTTKHRCVSLTIVLATVIACTVACGGSATDEQKKGTTGQPVTPEQNTNERIARVEQGLCQPLVMEGEEQQRFGIKERMQRFVVPAVTAAVIDGGELAWARAWGVRVVGSEEQVTTETMFQPGSVSKPVTAMLALALVADGVLELDAPINEVLRSWKVPDNELTQKVPVTLRHVITHQAGFTPFAYEVPRSEGVMPGMAELLPGGIRDWPAVTVEFEPGSQHAYSNSGYCVLQMVLEDASGLSLHELATKRLFERLGMDHSSFAEPLSDEVFATVAMSHNRVSSGLGGRKAVMVEGGAGMAPGATGGMWSTPTDIARLFVEVMRAWRGESAKLFGAELAQEVMTPQADGFGLGLFLQGEGDALQAGHGGSMSGFVTNMVFYPNAGKGAVVISSSGGGRWLNRELIAAIATEHDWPGHPVRRRVGTVTAEQIRGLAGVYGLDAAPEVTFTARVEGDGLSGQLGGGQPFDLTPTTEKDLFVLPRESLEMLFHRAPDGTVDKVTVRRAGEAGHPYIRVEDAP